MKIKRYRIVKDRYCGFEAQIWRLWWPFWVQMGCVNTHWRADDAEKYIKNRGVVRYVDI